MKIYESVSELIGGTPILRLTRFSEARELTTPIAAKLEYFNPTGSVKDRAALAMIDEAERRGELERGRGNVIIEPTSGNTGIGIAAIAASRGYRVILTMPETMSIERRRLLAAYGAEIVLTDGAKGMNGAIERANELKEEIPGAYIPGQFTNMANPEAHYKTTGREIWRDTDGKIDIFVAGVGTGGTISGTGRFLKEMNPNVKVVAVEPETSPVLSGGNAGKHGIQGIGAGFVPETFDRSVTDEIVTVKDRDAMRAARQLARTEGILTGISSGAALHAAAEIAARPENAGKLTVALLPDTGERYLSTELFQE